MSWAFSGYVSDGRSNKSRAYARRQVRGQSSRKKRQKYSRANPPQNTLSGYFVRR